MLRLREMRSVLEKAKTQGVSMQRRLVLYWFSMALAILAAVLLVVSLTGVFSNTAQKFGQSLTIQKHNTASALAGQMDQLTAPNIEELLAGFRSRVQTLTPMERTVLQYYIDGCSLEEVAARAYISVATAKKHNTNINRKLGVTSREELMLYIDLFRRCGRLDEIAAPRAEDTARCTT